MNITTDVDELTDQFSDFKEALKEILKANRIEDAQEIAAYVLDVDLVDYLKDEEMDTGYQYDIFDEELDIEDPEDILNNPNL